jgi:hypothetical protein
VLEEERTCFKALPQPDAAGVPAYVRRAYRLVDGEYRELVDLPRPADHGADVTAALKVGAREIAGFGRTTLAITRGADPVKALNALLRQTDSLSRQETVTGASWERSSAPHRRDPAALQAMARDRRGPHG